ncbi:hypothetical protein Afil01_64620 [Actinorhabdospora filicis]|uniref:DUF2470 domain-containing protein n=1 Tax=Actinorhabdospora filicis TaxID=1785913 RepID=A0A9W6SRL5_9ACTN|nr:DUF2470 domain-containing protein [Actinorhabdospora filicis]GLZ81655.1 hypothetical protein Afil01_64620 [Actinorhabdospora filicis]
MSNPFAPEVIEAITHHMNTDHIADTLVICQGAGGRPDAEDARMTGFDATGADFAVTAAGVESAVRIAWARPLSERAEVRPEIVRLYKSSVGE